MSVLIMSQPHHRDESSQFLLRVPRRRPRRERCAAACTACRAMGSLPTLRCDGSKPELEIDTVKGRQRSAIVRSYQPTQHPLPAMVLLGTARRPPLEVDAFAQVPLPRKLLYTFPPVPLIPPLLEKMRKEQLSIILIAAWCRGMQK